MAKQIGGWLPYGVDDDSVIFKHPLTREVTVGDLAGVWANIAYLGSGLKPTHDPVRGMLAKDVNGAEACYRFSGAVAAVVQPLDKCFEYTIEVARALVCANNPTYYSSGDIPAVAVSPFSMFDAGTLAVDFMQKGTAGSGAFSQSLTLGATYDYEDQRQSGVNITSLYIHSEGKGDYVTVNGAAWGGINGGIHILGIDGYPVGYGIRNNPTLNTLFQNFYLGSRRTAAGSFTSNWYIRNLQIAKRVPVWATHPLLATVVGLSDSIFDEIQVNGGPSYDVSIQHQFRRRLYQRGLKAGYMRVDENAGYRVSASGNLLKTRVPNVLANQPTLVPISGGTNDSADPAYNSANFLADYKDTIEQLFFGVAKNTRTSVRAVIPFIPQPRLDLLNNATYFGQHADIRANIASLPAWWNATYGPTYGYDRVQVCDLWTKFRGSHSTMSDPAVSSDGVHLGPRGNMWAGDALYGVVDLMLGNKF